MHLPVSSTLENSGSFKMYNSVAGMSFHPERVSSKNIIPGCVISWCSYPHPTVMIFWSSGLLPFSCVIRLTRDIPAGMMPPFGMHLSGIVCFITYKGRQKVGFFSNVFLTSCPGVNRANSSEIDGKPRWRTFCQ